MRVVVCLLLSVGVIGCAGRHLVNVTPDAGRTSKASSATKAAASPEDSLEAFMGKVRKLSAEARPARPAAATVEGNNPRLAAAVAAAAFNPSPASYRTAAEEYRRFGIFDKALAYLGTATALDPRDAATHDALARLWRDSGFPQLGLGDAYRALYFAPGSPIVHNTLGTIFQALGRRRLARDEYERALTLDPAAAYAMNNLCYAFVLDGEANKAIAACEGALRLQPDLVAAHNNLGLAHAVNGDLPAARAAFADTGDHATGLYNIGIVYMAQRDYSGAVDAFHSANVARPTMTSATVRAAQARVAKARGGE